MDNALFNGNDYLRGKKDGYNDGRCGNNKSYVRMGASLKFVIHGNPTLKSYIAGYNAGYSLGSSILTIENRKQCKTTKKEKTMYVFEEQIELLERMKSFLENMCEQWEESKATLENYLDDLDEEGLDESILEKFQEYYENQKEKLDELVREIEDEEIPYTVNTIDYLGDLPRP